MNHINYLVDPGYLDAKSIFRLINKYGESVRLIIERNRVNDYCTENFAHPPLIYPDFRDDLCDFSCTYFDLGIVEKILDDHQTFMLYDRTNRRMWETNSLKVARISLLINRSHSILVTYQINSIIYTSTPHNIFTWVFAKVAECLGVEVIYFRNSMVPWRFHMLRGLKRKPILINLTYDKFEKKDKEMQETKLFQEFSQKKHFLSLQAMPQYEKERFLLHKGRSLSIAAYIRANFRNPLSIINVIACKRRYDYLAMDFPNGRAYAVFFLHFQPERTTLPEGYGFAQQLIALQAFRAALPQCVKLLVKEHPSTFRNVCSWRERLPWFYDLIAGMGGTELTKMENNTYKLIDDATVVATITGSVAIESLLRGTPAIYFGLGGYHGVDHPFLHHYDNQDALCSFLEKLDNTDCGKDKENLSMLFDGVRANTIDGLNSDIQCVNDVEKSRQSLRTLALLRGMELILDRKLPRHVNRS